MEGGRPIPSDCVPSSHGVRPAEATALPFWHGQLLMRLALDMNDMRYCSGRAASAADPVRSTCLKNCSKIDPGASWGLLESSWSCLGSPEASWRPLGALLERSWSPLGPKKVIGDRLLAGPKAPRRLVFNCLGAKCPPKVGPRGVPKSGSESGPGSKRQNLDF